MFEIFGYSIYLIPFWKIELVTALPKNDVVERISSATRSGKGRSQQGKLFRGRVDGQRFKLRRLINYRNDFQPQVWGSVQSEVEGTVVTLWLFVHPVIIIFALIPLFLMEIGSGFMVGW